MKKNLIYALPFFLAAYSSTGVTCLFAQQTGLHLNRVIQLLEEKKPALGVFSADRSPRNAMRLSESDMDFVIIDMEHSPHDITAVQFFLHSMIDKREILAKGNPQPNVVPLVRIPSNGMEENQYLIKQVLDLGVYGIVIPHVDTPEQAMSAVQACRYPQKKGAKDFYPAGMRGAAGAPAYRYWGISLPEYAEKADSWPLDPSGELLVICQIESRQAVESITEIIDTPGLSAVFIGPEDLSFSYGYPFGINEPEVESAKQTVLEACLKKDIPCVITADEKDIIRRIKEGFRILVLGGGDGGPSARAVEILRTAREYLK